MIAVNDLAHRSFIELRRFAGASLTRPQRHFVERAADRIISRRFVKKQQMRWTMARWNLGMIAAV